MSTIIPTVTITTVDADTKNVLYSVSTDNTDNTINVCSE